MSQERATNNINNQVTMYFCFPYYEKKGDTSSSIKKKRSLQKHSNCFQNNV